MHQPKTPKNLDFRCSGVEELAEEDEIAEFGADRVPE